jgi:hypothetical protein
MDNTQFSRFAPLLRDMTEAQLASEIERPRRLLLATGMAGGKRIDIAYAPLDHVNVDARIVIVGLTPGRQQMRNALMEARRCLRAAAAIRTPKPLSGRLPPSPARCAPPSSRCWTASE